MKKYRLLRNNKETGPFSAEELIQSGFKKYDLVWADGKSAAWRYPGELDEFKQHAPIVEEQPFDRFYKKTPSFTAAKKEESVVLTEITAHTIIEPVKKEKPRIRIKADSHKIETNITLIERQQPNTIPKKEQPATTNTPEWKEMWLDWEQEKKAVNDFSSQKKDAPLLQTKFTQSLDDIKERYVETVLKTSERKTTASKSNNFITAAVLIAVILGTGIWMGIKWSSSPSVADKIKKPETEQALNNMQTSVQEQEPLTNNVITTPVNNDEPISDNSSAKTTSIAAASKNPVLTKNTPNTITKQPLENKIISQKQVVKPTVIKTPEVAKDDTYKSGNQAEKINIPEKNVSLPAETRQVSDIFRNNEKEPKIKDYITVDTYAPSQTAASGVKYKVSNISNIPVDMVMIDLQYFDETGRYVKGETVYVRNVQPEQTVTIQAPDNNKAASIKYKVSMVSSEKSNLYLIAD